MVKEGQKEVWHIGKIITVWVLCGVIEREWPEKGLERKTRPRCQRHKNLAFTLREVGSQIAGTAPGRSWL